jgi:hypothetical protein
MSAWVAKGNLVANRKTTTKQKHCRNEQYISSVREYSQVKNLTTKRLHRKLNYTPNEFYYMIKKGKAKNNEEKDKKCHNFLI